MASTFDKSWLLLAVNEYIFYYSHDVSTRFMSMLFIYFVMGVAINQLEIREGKLGKTFQGRGTTE
jgi:hypothetical protein